jgi:hypothetical protein
VEDSARSWRACRCARWATGGLGLDDKEVHQDSANDPHMVMQVYVKGLSGLAGPIGESAEAVTGNKDMLHSF